MIVVVVERHKTPGFWPPEKKENSILEVEARLDKLRLQCNKVLLKV